MIDLIQSPRQLDVVNICDTAANCIDDAAIPTP